MTRSVLLHIGYGMVTFVVLVSALWACLALWHQLPAAPWLNVIAAGVWAAFALGMLVLLWRGRAVPAMLSYAAGFALLMIWWSTILPSQNRDWADEVSRQFSARVDGHHVSFDNVRNFAWRSDTDYTARWESRRFDLDRLQTVDVIASYWSGPTIAHTLVSFGFDDGRFLTFSIEIRRERDESFSSIGGFFKKFETSLIVADEHDILRVRSNVRGEDVYLYRVRLAPDQIRSLFLAYLEEAGALGREPRFYNTLTANCTTIVYELARRVVPGLPLDYRLLASGYLPEYLHDVGALTPGFDIDTLRAAGRITARAQAADSMPDSDFSRLIRRGVPGTGD